jgi:hypothetical protein
VRVSVEAPADRSRFRKGHPIAPDDPQERFTGKKRGNDGEREVGENAR